MDIVTEIAFKDGVKPSEDVKGFVDEKSEKLLERFPDIQSIRVFIAVPHKESAQG